MDAALTYTAYRKMDFAGKIGNGVVPAKKSVNYEELLSNTIGCLTAIYDQEKLGKIYMSRVGHEDFAFWLQILKRGYKAYGLNEALAVYRTHKNSISGNKLRAASFVWNIYRNVEHLSFKMSVRCFLMYAYTSYKKHFIR